MEEVNAAAKKNHCKGGAEIVVVSLGPQGAVVKDSYDCSAPNVAKKKYRRCRRQYGGWNDLGASSKPLKEVIRWGVACGSAATMNEGTQLFKFEDAKLFEWLKDK
jgi:6-phosphofructokinase 2